MGGPVIPPVLKVQLSGEPLQTSPLELLTHSRLCYKRSMARWQRGRRRRGKLSGEGGSPQQPQQAIQPVYPDMVGEPEPAPSEPPVAGVEASSASQAQQQSGGRRRRRGRRGGRGGSAKRGEAVRSTQDQAAATAAQGTAGSAEETVRSGNQQGRDREAARRAGQQLPPLAPEYPPERYQQPLADVSPDLPAARPHPGPQRKPRGVVVLTIGLPGSGKSSWFKRRGVTPLSSDLLRTLLFDNITEQRYQDLVFSTLRSLLRARLIAGMQWNYIDATNLSPKERHGWIKMAREFGYEVHAVFFDVPLEVCMERNLRRARVVPEDVMRRMAAKLRPPSFEEGFSKVIVVRVKRSGQEPQAQAEESEASN